MSYGFLKLEGSPPLAGPVEHVGDMILLRTRSDMQPEAKGDVRLARATWSEGNDVLAAVDPFAAGQFQHLYLVELRNGAEVKALELRVPSGRIFATKHRSLS
ncbi:hypothetical protein PARHAE_03944 [Paracoccus haematequi]|uniref:Uncharacterized protein n=1 Tax=Paracoccus haematequi TaxID=2491866 RepID=A0A3S4CM62_9RHOB|nr:hypothetical protein PARHAE_03944 [Paracoccus haematequi]